MFELIFFGIFIGSLGGIIMMISQKVPLLRSLPEQMIRESFVTRPSKIKHAEAYLRSFLQWGRYEPALIRFLEKTLRRLRVWILKSDSFVSGLLQRLQKKEETESARSPQYWAELRVTKANAPVIPVEPVLVSAPSAPPVASPIVPSEPAPSPLRIESALPKLDGIRKISQGAAEQNPLRAQDGVSSRLKMLSLAMRAERGNGRMRHATASGAPVFGSTQRGAPLLSRKAGLRKIGERGTVNRGKGVRRDTRAPVTEKRLIDNA